MSHPLNAMSLWRRTLGPGSTHEPMRERLRGSLDSFRARVAQLVQSIGAELPGLTVHDISHLDALWRVADQICGPEYPVNPAEAFVLGGAILLHDAAHVVAAYPEGAASIKATVEWRDLIAQRYAGEEPTIGSNDEKAAIFQVLRHLHAEQAHKLATINWTVPTTGEPIYLLEDVDLRTYFGDLIGEVAASHHWTAHKVASIFSGRVLSPPSFLDPEWTVDAMKVAFLLRTADAAHLDDQRAPWFLFALKKPTGVSADHWRFQARMGQVVRTPIGQLRLTAGAPFLPSERQSWWLAYDTARMIDRELRHAEALLIEHGRPVFAAGSVESVESPLAFAAKVRVRDWEPMDVIAKVGDVPGLIKNLGGEALYGDDPSASLRELLQNGMDAVRALRSLQVLGPEEGSITVSLENPSDSEWWLHVTDTGIGMSRFVLTNVLLDFGNSLWRSDAMRDEIPGLASAGFDASGKFGIGFYSVFMLGDEVRVTSRRFQLSEGESVEQWSLIFDAGLTTRPVLVRPSNKDRLAKAGTRVSVRLTNAVIKKLLESLTKSSFPKKEFSFENVKGLNSDSTPTYDDVLTALSTLVGWLCPSSEVSLLAAVAGNDPVSIVQAGDWETLGDEELSRRTRSEGTKLYVLDDEQENLLGRVGVTRRRYSGDTGAITHHGVRAGKMTGLTGVCKAKGNNADAKRVSGAIAGCLADWQRWARRFVTDDQNSRSLARVHPLLPDHDFPVWELNGENLTLAALCESIRDWDSVVLHHGPIEHDNEDDVGSSRFGDYFCEAENIICCPDNYHHDFSTVLGAEPINYEGRLFDALKTVWGGVEVDEDSSVVGEVDDIEITRETTIFSRRAAN